MSEKLKKMCQARGVEYVDRGNGHIQLLGPLTVNYYPDSKKRSAYVAGTTKGRNDVTPEQALAMCFKPPKVDNTVRAVRKRSYRGKRAALIRKHPFCHWCGTPLTLDTSTIDHIIPLARGGLNNMNNFALACEKCNRDRADKMPELGADW